MLSGLFVALNVHILCGFTLDNASQYIFLSPLIFCDMYFTAPLAFQKRYQAYNVMLGPTALLGWCIWYGET